jgi:hypothetical protein
VPFSEALENSAVRRLQPANALEANAAAVKSALTSEHPSNTTRSALTNRKLASSSLQSRKRTLRSFESDITIPDMRQFTNSTRCSDDSVTTAPDSSLSTASTSTRRKTSSRAPVKRTPWSSQPVISTWSAT